MKKQALRAFLAAAVLLIGLFSVFPSSAGASSPTLGDYLQTVYDDSSGLVTREANAIVQTGDGYIYIGSYGGLIRYDGNNFVRMDDSTPLTVRCLFEDSQGVLWIGTNESGVYTLNHGKLSKLVTGSIASSVRAFTEGPDGRIYVGSTYGLAVIATDGSIDVLTDEHISGGTVSSLDCDGSAVWGVTLDGLLFVLDSDGQTPASLWSGSDFDGHSPTCVYAADDYITAGTDGSCIAVLSGTSASLKRSDIAIHMIETGKSENINGIYLDSANRLWVLNDTEMGYITNNIYFAATSLKFYGFFNSMREDYEGNLWIASTREGVLELSCGKFFNTNYATGLTDVTINATARYQGYLLAATDSGLTVLNGSLFPVRNELSDMLSGVRIRSLYVDNEGRLWIATYKTYGVICYDGNTITSVTSENGLVSDKTRCVLQLKNGSIAVATGGGVSILANTEGFPVLKNYTTADGMQNDVALCLCEYEDKLYVGTDGGGVAVISESGVSTIGERNGLSASVVLRLAADEEMGGIWASTGSHLDFITERDVFRLEVPYTERGSIFDIKIVGDDLWLLRSNAIVIASRSELVLSGSPGSVLLDKSCGLSGSITSNSWHWMENGLLYIATGDGIYRIDTTDIHKNTIPPRVIINSVQADDDTFINPSGSIELDSDVKILTIDTAALSFTSEECSVTYYLEGFDEEPMTVAQSDLVAQRYTNLPGGDYTLHLSACNADGYASRELTLTIHKKLAFWERSYVLFGAALLGALLITAIVVAIIKDKTRRLIERQNEYRNIARQALLCIANTIDAKDKYTRGHSQRVAAYTKEIFRRLGASALDCENMYYVALLHDIGKIGIPDDILNKPGRLTDEEFAVIKQHPRIGGDILDGFTAIEHIAEGARYHHERPDGRGYNKGLSGDQIPLIARVIGVADAYDAMSTPRVYRPELDHNKVITELKNGMGTQFDERIARIMISMAEDGFDPEVQDK